MRERGSLGPGGGSMYQQLGGGSFGIKAFVVSGVDSSTCHEIHLDMVIWSIGQWLLVIMGSKEHYI